MGVPTQPQGYLQIAVNLTDSIINPKVTLNLSRRQFLEENKVIAKGIPDNVIERLR